MNERRQPAVFLDRDGTLIHERHYLSSPAQVELIPGTTDALRRLSRAGFRLVVITNQSGIARGIFDEASYGAVRDHLNRILEAHDIRLDAVLHCPHHPAYTGPCDCRKPGLALYRQAIAELAIDPTRSWLIGDKLSDLEAARSLGARGLLVRTGFGEEQAALAEAREWPVVADLAMAASFILHTRRRGLTPDSEPG